MKNIVKFLFVFLVLFTPINRALAAEPAYTLPKVVCVFLHQPDDYSVMVEENNGFHIERLVTFLRALNGRTSNVREVLIKKIPAEEPLRVDYFLTEKNTIAPDGYTAVICIHGPQDLTGGEWRSGKGGAIHNQTEVVERANP